VCGGTDGKPLIMKNKIENIEGIGIRVGLGNKAQIAQNEIRNNFFGIEFISSDPYIFGNIIEKNKLSGIFGSSLNNIRLISYTN